MKPRHQPSRAAIVLIKRFEGFRANAAQLDDGRFTIGYGHTKTARANAVVSEADAEALLMYDLIGVGHAVNEWTFAPLNQNQFDALVSFAFNIGLENFHHSSTLRRLNEGRHLEAALAMELWRKADFEGERIVIDALVRRRAFEKALFLRPIDGWTPAPSPVLPPKLDYDVAAVLPNQRPTVVRSALEGARAISQREGVPGFQPLEDDTDHGPTASELAAQAVTARLEALLSKDERETIEQKALTSSEPANDLPFPEEAPRDIDEAPVVEPEAPEPAPVAVQPVSAADVAVKIVKPVRPSAPDRMGLVWQLALGAFGIAVFGAAVRWGFDPQGPLGGGFAGLLLGLVGVACFGAAVYLFLMRLGVRAPDDRG